MKFIIVKVLWKRRVGNAKLSTAAQNNLPLSSAQRIREFLILDDKK